MTRYLVLVICGLVWAARPAVAQVTAAYLIRPADGKPVVVPIPPESFPGSLPKTTRGILVWAEATGDRWLTLKDDGWKDRLVAADKPPADRVGGEGFSRGGRGGGGVEGALAGLTQTAAVDPRNVTEKIRGGELITPLPGEGGSIVRRPNLVVRRLAEDAGEKFPAIQGKLEGPDSTRPVVFPAGAEKITLSGLTPGTYTLTFPPPPGKALGINRGFTVESPAGRDRFFARADSLAQVLGADDPLVLLCKVELLLGEGATKGLPNCTADILDLLEESPDTKLSPYLVSLRQRLQQSLAALAKGAEVPSVRAPDPDATGVAIIDQVRSDLAAGRFKQAREALGALERARELLLAGEAEKAKELLDKYGQPDPNDLRTLRLATLYRAKALAETGAGGDTEAESLFRQVAQEVPASDRADQFRVHVNFALFYHRRAQDRLNNSAFQMAAGVSRTVSAVAADWAAAREQFDLAEKYADPRQAAELGPDLARLYALLAELIRALDPTDASRDLLDAASAAAARAADAIGGGDPVSRGIAQEVQGNLALSRGDLASCRKYAAGALADFLAAGFLPGIENAHQLLGRAYLKDTTPESKATATRHLTASHLVAELLRDRFKVDEIGRARAGFFARRAFVLDALVELHLDAGHPAQALELAEQAKARAFTDMLAADGVKVGNRAPRPLPQILKAWPKTTAAVEYFLGRNEVWAFVITTAGEVRASKLNAPILGAHPPAVRPVSPRELLARARGLVGSMEGYAQKMANRILNDEGFDNSWQDELHWLASVLLPADVLAELRKADVVLLAPQHVLHYLPFPALVLEKDIAASNKMLARPKRYVIDEPFVVVNVPSITGWDLLRQDKVAKVDRAAYAVGLVQASGEARLDGVETDLANLKQAYQDDLKKLAEGPQATPSNAAALSNRRGLLLLATHGYNDADAPLDSYLVLHPDALAPDGRWRARDVYKKQVRADVVVMSACYTGLGDRSPLPGDDLFGLQRAFLQAGARAVIAGLWDVYDMTAPELLQRCLTGLARGDPAARALKDAQKAFLDKYRAEPGAHPFTHPYFWAVYSVLGDDQAVTGRP